MGLFFLVFLFYFGELAQEEKEHVKVVRNGVKPIEIKGFSNVSLKEELSIDSEKIPEIISTIGSFDVDKEGNIYIFDYKAVKIAKFDKNGKYLLSFGAKGEGPGELQSVSSIQANCEEIVVTDPTNSKFVIFKMDGTLVKEIKFRFTIFNGIVLSNGNFLFLEPKVIDPEKSKMGQVISIYSKDFKKIKELEEIQMFSPFDAKIKGISFNISFALSKDRLYTGNQERDYEINVYDFNGKLNLIIKKEYKPLPITEEYKKNFIEELGDLYPMIKEKLYFPKFFPPLHYFLADEEGRLYVMTYEKGEKDGEKVFDIFNSEGKFIARGSFPDFSYRSGLRGKVKKGKLYCVFEKENGFDKLVVYKINWK